MWIRPCLALCEALAVSLFALQGCALTEGSEHPTSPQQRSSVLTESHSLYMHNEGPPIRKELLGTMFDPLVQGRSSTQNPTGLGLGLFIVKEIVSAHNGTVSVASSEDAGTTFSVSLPRR